MAEWDQLWTEIKLESLNYKSDLNPQRVKTYLRKVKAEGDKLKGDAEKWRKLHREDPDATIDIYEEFDGAIEELNFLREQLEDVRGICLQMHRTSRGKALEILDREFERSDASILSRYIAVKTAIQAKIDSNIMVDVYDLNEILKVLEVS